MARNKQIKTKWFGKQYGPPSFNPTWCTWEATDRLTYEASLQISAGYSGKVKVYEALIEFATLLNIDPNSVILQVDTNQGYYEDSATSEIYFIACRCETDEEYKIRKDREQKTAEQLQALEKDRKKKAEEAERKIYEQLKKKFEKDERSGGKG